MRIVSPKYFPHWGNYAYSCTRGGHFDPRVVSRLRRRGFTLREIDRLTQLYFAQSDEVRQHQDELGVFRNVRRNKLYRLSRRQMKYDRKFPLFELVSRSGMFYVFLDEGNCVRGFLSPLSYARLGIIPIERL